MPWAWTLNEFRVTASLACVAMLESIMRPEILNPLFAEVEALKGVGPQVAKLLEEARPDPGRRSALSSADRLDRTRAGACGERALLGRNVILDLTPFEIRESRSGRGPTRVFATDADGNTISLVYFNNPGWAKRSLPMGQKRIVSGKLEAYGDEWQIIHPEVASRARGRRLPMREPVYPLTEGLTNRRMGELAARSPRARARAAGMDRAEPCGARMLARVARFARASRIASPARTMRASGSLMTRFSPTSSRCCCCASRSGGGARCRSPGTGELTGKLKLPYQLTGAQRRVIEEIRGDLAQSTPMLRLLQGDVGSGKTLVALMAMLVAVESGAQAALLAPTEILARQHHATLLGQLDSIGVRVAILTGREKGRAREAC